MPGKWIAAASIPGVLMALLFYFDHNVSSQMTQLGYELRAPPAFNYDLLLMGVMVSE